MDKENVFEYIGDINEPKRKNIKRSKKGLIVGIGFLIIIIIIVTICALPGLKINSIKNNLEENQRFHEFTKNDQMLRIKVWDEDLFKDCIGEELTNDVDDMTKFIKDRYNKRDMDVDIINIVIENDTITITEKIYKLDDVCFTPDRMLDGTTLEDVVKVEGYDDFEDLADDLEFVTFKNEKRIDEEQLEDYKGLYAIAVYGYEEGAYFKIPGKIILVLDTINFKRITNDTIYVKDENDGIILFELD